MEVRIPIQMPGEKKTRWPVIRFERSQSGSVMFPQVHWPGDLVASDFNNMNALADRTAS